MADCIGTVTCMRGIGTVTCTRGIGTVTCTRSGTVFLDEVMVTWHVFDGGDLGILATLCELLVPYFFAAAPKI